MLTLLRVSDWSPCRAQDATLALFLSAGLCSSALGQFTNIARLPTSQVTATTQLDQHSAPVPLDLTAQVSVVAHTASSCTPPLAGGGSAGASVNSELSGSQLSSISSASSSGSIAQPCDLGGGGDASAIDRVTFSVVQTEFVQLRYDYSNNSGENGSSTTYYDLFGDDGVNIHHIPFPGSGGERGAFGLFLRPGNYELDTRAYSDEGAGFHPSGGGSSIAISIAPFTPVLQPQTASACSAGNALFWIDSVGSPLTTSWQVEIGPDQWMTLTPAFQPIPCGGEANVVTIGLGNPAEAFITVHPCPGMTQYQVRSVISDGTSSVTTNTATYSICYANCDCSGVAPILNVNDFTCFMNKFASGDSYANCDGSTTPPVLNVNDFICFQLAFAQGCP